MIDSGASDLFRWFTFDKDRFGVESLEQRIAQQILRLCSQSQKPVVVVLLENVIGHRQQVRGNSGILRVQQQHSPVSLARKRSRVFQRRVCVQRKIGRKQNVSKRIHRAYVEQTRSGSLK